MNINVCAKADAWTEERLTWKMLRAKTQSLDCLMPSFPQPLCAKFLHLENGVHITFFIALLTRLNELLHVKCLKHIANPSKY